MKKIAIIILILLMALPVIAKEVTLRFAWDANSESDMKGYSLFVRQDEQAYDYTDPKDPTCTIDADGKCYVNPIDKTCEYELSFDAPDGVISTFYFVARAYDTDVPPNWSDDSNEVSRTFDLRAIPAPTMLAGVYNDTTKKVTFSWQQTQIERVIKWELYKSSISGGPYTKVGETADMSLAWDVPGDGNYFFTLVAFTDEVYSVNANEAYVQVKVHPSPVKNFRVKIRIK